MRLTNTFTDMAKKLKDEVPVIEPDPYIMEPPGPYVPKAEPEQAAPINVPVTKDPHEHGRKLGKAIRVAHLDKTTREVISVETTDERPDPETSFYVRLNSNEAVQPGDRWDPVSGWVVPDGDTRDLRPLPMRLRSVMDGADPAAAAAILPDYITLTMALRSGLRTPARAWLAGLTGGTKAVSTLRAALLAELDR